MKNRRMLFLISVIVAVILYAVGIVNVAFLDNPGILDLTVYQLLITALLIVLNDHLSWTTSLLVFAIIFIIGWGVEYMGVSTGWPFGHYEYGEMLGVQVLDTPLMIGVNWFIVVVSGANFVNFLIQSNSTWIRALVTSILLVGFDFVMEPVAIHYEMWHWRGDEIPLSNYASWFFLSLLMSEIYFLITKSKVNRLAAIIFVLLLLFFMVLRINM